MDSRQAAEYIGCARSTIYLAIRNKRYFVLQHTVTWKDDKHDPLVIRHRGRHCFIDGIEYKSVLVAAKHYGFRESSLYTALDCNETFKGHKVTWTGEAW
jgi:hypothetical protein